MDMIHLCLGDVGGCGLAGYRFRDIRANLCRFFPQTTRVCSGSSAGRNADGTE